MKNRLTHHSKSVKVVSKKAVKNINENFKTFAERVLKNAE